MPLATSSKPYKYEVAFSFLAQDEAMAYAINDLLQDRLSTFVYSQKQKDLVGRDGMIAFREVFESEARIVVILYREEWGTTEWTRVEEEAIKDRVREEGTDFLVVVNLDKGKPKWLSRGHMRLYLERFGMKEAVAVIEKRVEEFGGVVREETVKDRVERNRRELEYAKWFAQYYASVQAVADAWDEFRLLKLRIEDIMKGVNESGLGYSFGKYDFHENTLMFHCAGRTFWFKWNHRYANTLAGSTLEVAIENGTRFDQFRSPNDRIETYASGVYTFSVDKAKERCWSETNEQESRYTTEKLLDQWVKPFLDQVHGIRMNEQRERMRT